MANQHTLSKDDLRKILDNSFDEIFVVNRSGTVVYVNDACERHYGLKPSEVIGKTVHHLVSEGYYSPVLAPIVFRDKKQVTLEQKTHLGKKLVVTATPVLDERGEVELIVMNSRDITQIEQLRQDLANTNKLVERYKIEVQELRQQQINCSECYTFRSKKMRLCMETGQRVAPVNSTILLLGESGTGKSIFAKNIHKMSQRSDGPFITINCAAIPEQLMESELFGYRPGAFTGADKTGKVGLVELAHGGTLFLDEVGEIPLILQAKLLQLIQEHKYLPIGAKEDKEIDVRIIAATNRDLSQLVEQGTFREDLYYRLDVIEIEIPPLREREEDIIPLLNYFLNKYDSEYNVSHQFGHECLDILLYYTWPGNVREMEHLVERLVVTVPETVLQQKHLPKKFHEMATAPEKITTSFSSTIHFSSSGNSLKEKEEDLIIQLYKKLKSSYKVAETLKISQSKVSRVVRKHLANHPID
ncbi:RNA polymerase sigma factor 54 interaction domain protein [Acididesulfobacillus acetoxydans]|uniref:Nif-specific regulatory protein n=1 Tax=Acididesulfobacillus acetoxydans TaxID=1561005 RepID=A0A8S0VYX0_9FIRM|nr:sigma 54-interacting transcriptional regulator [Acididesulfobacillus acetoxydans]CAA7603433.1 RNA polymerase sigma factor 54 interaction domain protein [Acididesulfobacillus acetoxydans]CEJ07152.1 Nif-specific regulatory protein [Acididesulfobacillus acetoxydans]